MLSDLSPGLLYGLGRCEAGHYFKHLAHLYTPSSVCNLVLCL